MPPSPAAAKIIELRELLARKCPAPPPRRNTHLSTGIGPLDAALEGGLWKGGMVEIVEEGISCGGASLLRGILGEASARGLWAALIDGSDCFDPQAAGAKILSRLLWIRCRDAAEAMQSADLLLRDGNLPLVFLDLHRNPATQLRKVASQTWYRLQRMIEPTATAFLAITPFPLIPCADVRLSVGGRFSLEALEESGLEVLRQITLQVLRKRRLAGLDGGEALAAAG